MIVGPFARRRSRCALGPLNAAIPKRGLAWFPVFVLCLASGLGGASIASMPAFGLKVASDNILADVTDTGAVTRGVDWRSPVMTLSLEPSPLGGPPLMPPAEAPVPSSDEAVRTEGIPEDIALPPVPEVAVVFITPALPAVHVADSPHAEPSKPPAILAAHAKGELLMPSYRAPRAKSVARSAAHAGRRVTQRGSTLAGATVEQPISARMAEVSPSTDFELPTALRPLR
jgi:hypothetical protein